MVLNYWTTVHLIELLVVCLNAVAVDGWMAAAESAHCQGTVSVLSIRCASH